MSEISIIIVNYNTPELTNRCVESIKKSSYHDYEIIVVDNNSHDNSLTLIKRQFPDILTIKNNNNEGFGRANNLGFKQAKGNYILFLNSDMVLTSDTLSIAISEIKSNESIGVLSCPLFNEDGTKQKSLFYFSGTYKDLLRTNLILDKVFNFERKEVRAVIGAFMLIPRKVLNEVGLFDPDFFMYSEELELCHRIRNAGYKIYQTDKTTAIHKHGGSTTDGIWSQRQKLVSSQLLFRKNKGPLGFFIYHFLFVINSLTNFFAMWILNKEYRKDFLKQQLLYLFTLRYFWTILFLSFKKNQGYLKV